MTKTKVAPFYLRHGVYMNAFQAVRGCHLGFLQLLGLIGHF